MTLLIADDEELIRFTIMDMISEFSLPIERLIEAENGTELKKKFREESPELVLADIRMPGISGLDALEELGKEREDSVWIILTGHSDFHYARQALRLNVLDYLLKPPAPGELREALERGIELHGEARSLSGQAGISDFEPKERDVSAENRSALLAEQAKKLIEGQYDREIGIAQIADQLRVTPNYLSSVFHEQTGMKFTRYLTDLRIQKAKALLSASTMTVKEIAAKLGYSSGRYFSGLFRQETGISPTDYMKRYRS